MSTCPSPSSPAGGAPSVRGVRRGLIAPAGGPSWELASLAGRFGEISASPAGAPLTMAFRLIFEAQQQNEPTVWITERTSVFFPPDAAETGVDLSALVVVRAPVKKSASLAAARVADHLLRSGAFGLVVLDLGARARLPIPTQTRLVGLAKKYDTALLCITEKEKERPSLGSLVSIRAEATRKERAGERYRCEVRVLKDKRRGPGFTHVEVCHGPDGLR